MDYLWKRCDAVDWMKLSLEEVPRLGFCGENNENFEFHTMKHLKFSKNIMHNEVSYMANELTFLRTSTSPSVVAVTFGIGSSSLMVFT
jgi:hypothetical protein